MKMRLYTRALAAELVIETGNTVIKEDVSNFGSVSGYQIEESIIRNIITVANDMSRFNGTSDVEFVKMIYDAFLNKGERTEFLETITKEK